MTTSVVIALLVGGGWLAPTEAKSIDGTACYYGPGLMKKVARNRGMSLYGYMGGVALDRRGDLGRSVWLRWDDGDIDGPFLVVDCAQKKHVGGCIVEVSASIAKKRKFFGVDRVPVRVYLEDGPTADRLSDPYTLTTGHRPPLIPTAKLARLNN